MVCTVAPPAENYCSWMSPEIAESIKTCVINREYYTYLDYNGDGELNIADVVSVEKRYKDNIRFGNSYTLDSNFIELVIEENYAKPPIEWEICSVEDSPCCLYELTVDEITNCKILFDFYDHMEIFTVEVNPYMEICTVLD